MERIANKHARYLKALFFNIGIKYPINTPIAQAGVYVSEHPAINEIPKGSSLSKTTALEKTKPQITIKIWENAAKNNSFGLKSSIFVDIFTTSFNFYHPQNNIFEYYYLIINGLL